jgi:hypothetical protein
LSNILRIFAFKFKGHSNSNNALISMLLGFFGTPVVKFQTFGIAQLHQRNCTIHAKMANYRYKEDYHTHFDPKDYLEQYYKNLKGDENEDGPVLPIFKALHEFWSSFNPNGKAPTDTDVRYLEFGGGPSIINLVFACSKVDHIVFSEYAEINRQAVKSWIAGNPDAHDWTPLIEIVLELEQGRGIDAL